MSLYIEEMTLPHEDVEPMHLELYADGTVFFMKAPDDCYEFKAVPVPPHGDLIDRREAIIDANERAYDFWLSDDEVNASIQFLKEQPTIIPAEEGKT